MIYSYSDSPVEKGDKKAIFLAGPTIRKEQEEDWLKESWRTEALNILEELNFEGVVYIPEYMRRKDFVDNDKQFEWEWEALHAADVIVFWVPRVFPELPALTTNVEFGFYIDKGKTVVYGRPDNSDRNGYLDRLYKKVLNKNPFSNLKELLKEAVKWCE